MRSIWALLAALAGVALGAAGGVVATLAIQSAGTPSRPAGGTPSPNEGYESVRSRLVASRFWDGRPSAAVVDTIVDAAVSANRDDLLILNPGGKHWLQDHSHLTREFDRRGFAMDGPPEAGERIVRIPLWRFRARPDRTAAAQAILHALNEREWQGR